LPLEQRTPARSSSADAANLVLCAEDSVRHRRDADLLAVGVKRHMPVCKGFTNE
jgi:hypothetical protein